MLEIERKKFIFKTKEIWFSDRPFDVEGYDSVTFRACKNKVDIKGFECEDFITFVIDITQDLDTIWKNMSKSSCRYGVNRANRDGVRIKMNQNYNEFYEINQLFRDNKGLPLDSLTIEFMKKYGTLFVAEFDGEILVGQFYLEDESNIRWLIGASKRLEVDKEKAILIGNANRLTTWQAIQYAKEKGVREFDFGGYRSGGRGKEILDAPNLYKKSFGGIVVVKYNYQKDYSKIYKLAKKIYRFR